LDPKTRPLGKRFAELTRPLGEESRFTKFYKNSVNVFLWFGIQNLEQKARSLKVLQNYFLH
ncbi:hypothetical protein, partial [Leptospira kirschneri]|uniref:hypothetical protein n=1 Tax=Leptospira kirschneri TaxID=29507 RepID=UPI00369CEAEE